MGRRHDGKGPWWGWWWILGEGDARRGFGCDVENMGKAVEIGKVSRSVAINKQKDIVRQTITAGTFYNNENIGPSYFLREKPWRRGCLKLHT